MVSQGFAHLRPVYGTKKLPSMAVTSPGLYGETTSTNVSSNSASNKPMSSIVTLSLSESITIAEVGNVGLNCFSSPEESKTNHKNILSSSHKSPTPNCD